MFGRVSATLPHPQNLLLWQFLASKPLLGPFLATPLNGTNNFVTSQLIEREQIHCEDILHTFAHCSQHFLLLIFLQKMPIVSQSKSLVKKGKLTRIFKENKGFLGNKKKESLHLFLFNDTLIIAKKKK